MEVADAVTKAGRVCDEEDAKWEGEGDERRHYRSKTTPTRTVVSWFSAAAQNFVAILTSYRRACDETMMPLAHRYRAALHDAIREGEI